MADPTKYKVTVKQWFTYQDVIFRPAETEGPKAGFPRYQVPAAIYNGTIDDGTAFASMCASADPVFEDDA